MTVLLRGPARLFKHRATMLASIRGEGAPFTEVDGKMVCTKCGQVIETRRSATGKRTT